MHVFWLCLNWNVSLKGFLYIITTEAQQLVSDLQLKEDDKSSSPPMASIFSEYVLLQYAINGTGQVISTLGK